MYKLGTENLNVLFKYVNIVKEYALTTSNSLGIYLLLEICSISPLNITQILSQDLEWLKVQSMSVNDQVRYYSAELWSLVLINNIINSQQRDSKNYQNLNFESLFSNLINLKKSVLDNPSKSFESKHGAILNIGFALGKYLNLTNSNISNDSYKESLKTLTLSIGIYKCITFR